MHSSLKTSMAVSKLVWLLCRVHLDRLFDTSVAVQNGLRQIATIGGRFEGKGKVEKAAIQVRIAPSAFAQNTFNIPSSLFEYRWHRISWNWWRGLLKKRFHEWMKYWGIFVVSNYQFFIHQYNVREVKLEYFCEFLNVCDDGIGAAKKNCTSR